MCKINSINSTFLTELESSISSAKNKLRKEAVNSTMQLCVISNNHIEQAVVNVENEEMKLYEKTAAVFTVQEEVSSEMRKLYNRAAERNILPKEEVQDLYDALHTLLEKEKAFAEAVESILSLK